MQPKISLKRLLTITTITIFVFFITVISFLTFYLPGHVYTYYIESISTIPGIPVHLKIPKINVDAEIISVGINSIGEMDTPKGPKEVAWFNLGPRPGSVGSAVFAGHYGTWKNGDKSVFDNLNKLKNGDEIYVEDENEVVTTFIVTKILTYAKDENAANVFSSNDNKSHLNIVTCEGNWDNIKKTYSNRLIIFTDKK